MCRFTLDCTGDFFSVFLTLKALNVLHLPVTFLFDDK
jgi:hypothetical protein